MKVKCEQCGKHFDYDTYMGICPKCSAYYMKKANYIGETVTQEPSKTIPQEKKESSTRTSKIKRSRNYYIVTACLIITMLLMIATTIFFSYYKNKQGYDAGTLTQLPKAVSYSMNKTIPIQCSSGTFELTITNSAIYQNDNCLLPEGYEIITVSYSINDLTNDSYDVRRGLKPYLFTKSGSYLRPLSDYDFENLQILEPDAIKQLNISDYFEYDEDLLYFLVKKNDTASLRINYHDTTDSDSPDILKECYEITGLEVK